MLPNEYRKSHNLPVQRDISDPTTPIEQTKLTRTNHLAKLSKYLDMEVDILLAPIIEMELVNIPVVDTRVTGSKITDSFKKIISIGSSKDVKESKIQVMLKTLQNDIKFTYAQIDDLFGHDVVEYLIGRRENTSFCFDNIDDVIDILLALPFETYV